MSARRRILYVIPSFEAGGAEAQVVEHLRRLPRDRFSLELALCRRTGRHLANVPDDVAIHGLGGGRGPWHLPFRVRRLRRLMRETRPDIVVSHLWYADLLSLLAGGLARRVCVLHADHAAELSSLRRRQRLGLRLTERLYRRADVLVGPPWIMSRYGGGATLGLQNGIDPRNLTARARAAPPPEWPGPGLRLMAMGRLHPVKGFDVLLDALVLARQRGLTASLLVAGEGQERTAMSVRAKRLGGVALPGYLTNPYPALAHADVFVLSSRSECMATVVSEALALGTPVLATPCAARHLDGAGVVVPAEDSAALAQALLDLAASPEQRAALAERGRARVEQFGWDHVLPQLVELYESL